MKWLWSEIVEERAYMKTRRIIFTVFAYLLVAGLVELSTASASCSNDASGNIEVSNDGARLRVEFEVREAANSGSGGGFFRYGSADRSTSLAAEVFYVKVDDEYAWFAGRCVQDSGDLAGRWFFAAVHDGGTPGSLADHIWWDWLPEGPGAEKTAKRKVENLERPVSNKPIKTGNVVVNLCE